MRLSFILPIIHATINVTIPDPVNFAKITTVNWSRAQKDPLRWDFRIAIAQNRTDIGLVVADVESGGAPFGVTNVAISPATDLDGKVLNIWNTAQHFC